MVPRETALADRLGLLWDDLVLGDARGLEDETADIAEPLRSLVARSAILEPSPTFLAWLERRLAPGPMTPFVDSTVSAQGGLPARRSADPTPGSAPRVIALATAAMVVLTLTAALAVFRAMSNQDSSGPSHRSGATASPVAVTVPGPEVPVRFDECTVEPLPTGHVESLSGTATRLPAELVDLDFDPPGQDRRQRTSSRLGRRRTVKASTASRRRFA